MVRYKIFYFLVSVISWFFGQKVYLEDHNSQNFIVYPDRTWRLVPFPGFKGNLYNHDNLATVNRHSFLEDERFNNARQLAESRWMKNNNNNVRNITWRLHTALWGASVALNNCIEDAIFVECGTGRGFMAAGITSYFNFDELHRPDFYLVDIFSEVLYDVSGDVLKPADFAYTDDVEEVKEYFSKYSSVKVKQGLIPDCLTEIPDQPISFLHIDLNSAFAEAAVLEKFKSRLCKGSLILFDDYGGPGGEEQALVHDAFALNNNRDLLSLPTGQAVIIW
jgi:hypothetical protein